MLFYRSTEDAFISKIVRRLKDVAILTVRLLRPILQIDFARIYKRGVKNTKIQSLFDFPQPEI